MDLPIVEYSEQRRPSLKGGAISNLISASSGQEQALYILLASTGMRVSEALALEARQFINGGRTIRVEQQVAKDSPRIVNYLKTSAAKREVDLHPDIAEFCETIGPGSRGSCSRQHEVRPISTAISKTAGLRLGLPKWDWTKKGWVGTRSSGIARRGCVALAAWKTSTTSGWRTNRKPCLSFTHTSTRSWNCASQRLNEWASVSICRRALLLQMLQEYPIQNRRLKLQRKLQKGEK